MLDLDTAKHSAKQHYYDLSQRAQEMTQSEPDGTNAGISRTEAGIAMVAAMGAGLLTRKLLRRGWMAVTDEEPPQNPASHEVAWKDAIIWGAISGAVAGVARIASRRASSAGYRNYLR